MIRMLFPEGPEQIARRRIRQRTTRLQIRQYHFLPGIQDLGRLRHEMNPRKHDQVSRRLLRLLSQPKTIADIVSHILDIRLLIIMCEHNRIFFPLQPFYFQEKVELRRNRDIQEPFFMKYLVFISAIVLIITILFNKELLLLSAV